VTNSPHHDLNPRLFDTSRTSPTTSLREGVNVKVVSERLGHASPAFTMTVYQHVVPGMQADAARTFEGIIRGGAAESVGRALDAGGTPGRERGVPEPGNPS
jgi:hypothetical protein